MSARRPPYLDFLGRAWTVERLDALLADEAVRLVVEQGARIGQRRDDASWSPGKVVAWSRRRYRREEPAALLLLLVTRFFDLGNEPDLEEGAAP